MLNERDHQLKHNKGKHEGQCQFSSRQLLVHERVPLISPGPDHENRHGPQKQSDPVSGGIQIRKFFLFLFLNRSDWWQDQFFGFGSRKLFRLLGGILGEAGDFSVQ